MGDTDEKGCQDEERSQVDGYNSFKKEVFEEVCSIDDDEDENGWEVNGEDGIVNTSLQNNFDMNSNLSIICIIHFSIKILSHT